MKNLPEHIDATVSAHIRAMELVNASLHEAMKQDVESGAIKEDHAGSMLMVASMSIGGMLIAMTAAHILYAWEKNGLDTKKAEDIIAKSVSDLPRMVMSTARTLADGLKKQDKESGETTG